MSAVIACAGLALALAACSGGSLLDQEKRSPDEFAVYSRAPLSLPPGYNLRPPAPGTSEFDPYGPRTEARSALIGGTTAAGTAAPAYAAVPSYGSDTDPMVAVPPGSTGAASGGFGVPTDDVAVAAVPGYAGAADSYGAAATRGSPGADAILNRTGGAEADPAIRDLVNRETAILAEEDQSFVESLIFWGTPTEYGTIVDPVEERRRINENQALGRTITSGTTPTIERQKRALLEGVFD